MKTSLQIIRKTAVKSGHLVTLKGHFEQDRTQMEVFLPDGISMLCESVRTVPRNLSAFVTPDALRAPASLIKCSTATVWFVWMDNGLHGQFHQEADAMAFITA